jgi:UDP-N-acetyl-D-glucosamine dehydrogenase
MKNKKVSVIGQGYVGLPLSVEVAKSGYMVIGFDTSENKVININQGKSPVEDITDVEITSLINQKIYKATSIANDIKDSGIFIICVPTPVNSDKSPNLDFLLEATNTVGKSLKDGDLVIVESTISPGTCRDILIPKLVEVSGLRIDQFNFAFSPERIDPLNKKWNIRNTPKIVSGYTVSALNLATRFYEKFIDTVIQCKSLEIAETAKLLENSFRLVNISFINEISIFCQKMGIEINEVIEAASTKPYGFMPFYPSVGIGGHCIPVDPLYLSAKAHEINAPTRFIDLADQVNREMPSYFAHRAEEIIGSLEGKKLIVVGISYKPNVADTRETPVEDLIIELRAKGSNVVWHDDLVKNWKGEKSSKLDESYDLAIVATPHDYINLDLVGKVPILNTRRSS